MHLLGREELERIPARYRLLVKIMLKFPNPSLPFLVLKHLPAFEGIFWAILMPLFLAFLGTTYFWFIPFLSVHFPFPLNLIIAFLIPASIFVFFLRIQLERTILWWRSIHEEPREWQTSKRVEEFIEILNKQQKRKKS